MNFCGVSSGSIGTFLCFPEVHSQEKMIKVERKHHISRSQGEKNFRRLNKNIMLYTKMSVALKRTGGSWFLQAVASMWANESTVHSKQKLKNWPLFSKFWYVNMSEASVRFPQKMERLIFYGWPCSRNMKEMNDVACDV